MLNKIPCLKCGGRLSHLIRSRMKCDKCGQEYKYGKIKRTKRKLEKKCKTCGKLFKNSHRSVLNCSEKCSVIHRKKWFVKYNKIHKKEINKSRKKYEKNNPNRKKESH